MIIFKLRYYNSQVLTELNARFGLLRKGMSVIELGSGAGIWTNQIRKAIDSDSDNPKLFAVDEVKLPYRYQDGVVFIHGEVEKQDTLIRLQKELKLQPVDLLISNLEAESQNDRDIDNFLQINLNRIALNIALKTLKTGATLLMKAKEGLPEEQNFRFVRLFFKELIKVRPQTIQFDASYHYYLGLGFKQRDEYLRYPTFFQKVLHQKENELLEEEIPPSYQTQAERDLEVLEFLQYASKHQIAVTQKQIDEIKINPRYKNINWENYPLFIVPGPLTEYQEQMIIIARYQGKLSFSPNTQSEQEDMKEAEEIVQQIERAFQEKEKSSELLREGEVLGQGDDPVEEELKFIRDEAKLLEKDIKEGRYNPDPPSQEEMEKYEKWLNEETQNYLRQNYPDASAEQIIQEEIFKGNITKEELEEYFELKEQELMDKAEMDYEFYLKRNAEKVSNNMTKEHRQEYYNRKKKLKSRRQ